MNLLKPLIVISFFIGVSGFQSNRPSSVNEQAHQLDDKLLSNGRSLDGWEVPDFGSHGRVYLKDGAIILEKGGGCTGISWQGEFPKINYRVTLEAMRIDGSDFFCAITFPVLEEFCTLIVGGWGGSIVGLSNLDGDDAFHNSTGRMIRFKNKRWYHIRLLVTKERIKAWLGNKVVVDFERYDERLSVRREMLLSRPFGITSWETTAAIRNIRVSKILNWSPDE